jgi:hypothetical protein
MYENTDLLSFNPVPNIIADFFHYQLYVFHFWGTRPACEVRGKEGGIESDLKVLSSGN